MATSDFSEAKAYLAQNAGGNNLYDHLSEVLLKLISERPNQSHELFEHLSMVVKQAKFKPGNGLEGAQFDASAAKQDAEDAMAEWTRSNAAMFQKVADDPDGAAMVADLMADLDSLEWASFGYGREEAYRIQSAMAMLAIDQTAAGGAVERMRFWGKILGTGGDYYVVECSGEFPAEDAEAEPEEEGPDLELGKTGPNKCTYFVASSPESAWSRLPNVKASQLAAAGSLKRFFTGDLSAPVKGHPPFPGTEKEYLRAQIARITAGCDIAPDGVWAEPEDKTEGIQKPDEEEAKAPELEACLSADGWRHTYAAINPKTGRCVPTPGVDADGEPEEIEFPPLLWELEEGEYTVRAAPSSCATLRSEKWPGAAASMKGASFCWTYAGYGHMQQAATTYTPSPPAAPAAEFDDSAIREQMDVLADPTPPADEDEDA